MLSKADPIISELITQETERQKNNIELIASENFVSPAVIEATGSYLTNKYAEGYPGKRYYGGCEVVDKVESLAINRAKELFNAEHANVQPHSGSQANMAVYFAFLEPGDTMLGMNLSHGGHLTHGSKVSISGKYFNAEHYGVDRKSELINYAKIKEKVLKVKPSIIIAGTSAYPRQIDFEKFREIADSVGSYLMVDMAHIAGLVAVGLHPDPVPHADFVTSTTHKTLRSTRGGLILCKKKYAGSIDKGIFPGIQGGPLMHIIAAKAVGFKEALKPEFKEYQQSIVNNARTLAEKLKILDFNLVSGGTDTHLLLINLNNKGITGSEAESLLGKVGITVNKNTVPYESRSANVTSGIRIGTPAVTTRGMDEKDMEKIADFIYRTLLNRDNQEELDSIRGEINEFCSEFPLHKSEKGE